MSFRLPWRERGTSLLLLFVSLGSACSEGASSPTSEERSPSTVMEHRAPDVEPLGLWFGESNDVLLVERMTEPNRVRLRRARSDRAEVRQEVEADWEPLSEGSYADGEMNLDSVVMGSRHWFFCRFGDEEVLLPETVAFVGEPRSPSGAVFRPARAFRPDPMMGYQIPPGMETGPTQRGAGDD
jgi:hypothetical protein